jgi:hypothetical protein
MNLGCSSAKIIIKRSRLVLNVILVKYQIRAKHQSPIKLRFMNGGARYYCKDKPLQWWLR